MFLRQAPTLCLILFATQIARCADPVVAPALSASLLENDVLRLRVAHLSGNFAEEFLAAQPTNKLDGIILDLRAADGDKNAAVAAGNLFSAKQWPLVILVDDQTRGAAARLAADLRLAGDGILVGSTNFAGPAKPDITVVVSSADEKNFLADPFFMPASPKSVFSVGTNEFMEFVDHTSEDDLVRKRVKDGEEDDSATPRVAPSQPVIRDPALARALDLFKALAVLHRARG